jgi:hypothetical protein
MSVGSLARDTQDLGDLTRLKGSAAVKEGPDLTFTINHGLNVTFQLINVKFSQQNVIS